ncbi:MAG: hypothetical protein IGS03_13920 [Candidatus Sericytochromatia bacterium]|nr:hypothetical protein [Candidatus Sericytochromatia bacterium]
MRTDNNRPVVRPQARPTPPSNRTSPQAPASSPRPPARPPSLGGGDRSQAAARARDNLQGGVSFPDRTSGVARASDPTVDEMAAAIRNYPDSRATTVAASREIAQAAQDAAAQFGVDPRQLLAVWARESQFDPRRSEGNGRGLGQLTAPAVNELQRISKGGRDGTRSGVNDETYAMLRTPKARAAFARLESPSARLKTRDSAMGSAAYLRLMMDINNGNRTQTLRDYNGAGGAIERAYPGHIARAYQDLFGGPMPATLQMR